MTFFFFFCFFCFFVFCFFFQENRIWHFMQKRHCSMSRIFPYCLRCWRPDFRNYHIGIFITSFGSPMYESEQEGGFYHWGIIQSFLPTLKNSWINYWWELHLVTFLYGKVLVSTWQEQNTDGNTVDSRYLEFQGTLWNTSRYPYLDISDLQNWGKNNSNNHI